MPPNGARGLLLTVLGEFVLPGGGPVFTSAFIDVLGRLGVEEKAARQALTRSTEAGWLAPRRVGRRTCWALAPAGERLLGEGTERIYAFTGVQDRWDGRWLLVLARTPETDRSARHRLRTRLGWAGLASPAPGVWISTHAERVAEVRAVLAEVGVPAQVFVAEHAGGDDLTGMVGQAWDLAAIDAGYRGFLAEFDGPADADSLARLLRLVHAWRRFPLLDPSLPRSLLPDHWGGQAAADLFARQHAALVEPARAEWHRITTD